MMSTSVDSLDAVDGPLFPTPGWEAHPAPRVSRLSMSVVAGQALGYVPRVAHCSPLHGATHSETWKARRASLDGTGRQFRDVFPLPSDLSFPRVFFDPCTPFFILARLFFPARLLSSAFFFQSTAAIVRVTHDTTTVFVPFLTDRLFLGVKTHQSPACLLQSLHDQHGAKGKEAVWESRGKRRVTEQVQTAAKEVRSCEKETGSLKGAIRRGFAVCSGRQDSTSTNLPRTL